MARPLYVQQSTQQKFANHIVTAYSSYILSTFSAKDFKHHKRSHFNKVNF